MTRSERLEEIRKRHARLLQADYEDRCPKSAPAEGERNDCNCFVGKARTGLGLEP